MIKTAKQWFDEELSGEPLTEDSVIEVIKLAQIQAVKQTIFFCARRAQIIHDGLDLDHDSRIDEQMKK